MPPVKSENDERAHELAGIQKINLPFSTVVTIAMNGLKIRFWRSMVTAAGIFLGITFLSYVTTNLQLSSGASADDQARMKWLVVMSLLVSTVGIVNSMLMSVTERFREIGTMKCLGAPDQFVVNLFFVEAVFVGLIASAAGWLLGYIGSVIVNAFAMGFAGVFKIITPLMSLKLMAGCILTGGFITLIATIAPASRAAAMPAAAALRSSV